MKAGLAARTLPAIAALLLLCGPPVWSEAEASQVHYRDVDLGELVGQSNLIIVAKPLKPFRTVKREVLRGRGRNKTTFRATRYHFSISRVLKNTVSAREKVRLSGKIEVTPADEGINRSITRAYLRGQPVPSPIILRYLTKVKLPEAGKQQQELVLFLTWYPPAKNPRFAVVSSYEHLDKLAAIKKLIRTPRKKAGGE